MLVKTHEIKRKQHSESLSNNDVLGKKLVQISMIMRDSQLVWDSLHNLKMERKQQTELNVQAQRTIGVLEAKLLQAHATARDS